MKKTILSVAVATTLGLTMGSANASTPCDSAPNGYDCNIVEDGTNKDGNAKFDGGIGNGQQGVWFENGSTDGTTHKALAYHVVDDSTTKFAFTQTTENGAKVGFEAEVVTDSEGNKTVSIIGDNDTLGLTADIVMDGSENGTIVIKRGDEVVLEKTIEDGSPIVGKPIVEPIPFLPIVEPLTRDEIAAYIEANKENRNIDSYAEAQAALDFITTYTGNGKVVELSKDGQTITVDGTEYTIEQAKAFIKEEAAERSHNDDLLNPIVPIPEPIEPIAGNPDAIKAYAKNKVVEFKDNADNETKYGYLANIAAERGFKVEVGEGEDLIVFTHFETGEKTEVTTAEFNAYMLAKHEERKAGREFEGDNPIPDTKLRRALDTLWEAGQSLTVVGQESKAKLQASAQSIKAGAEDLTEAGQTLKTDLTAGKSELEAVAQSATEQMAAQFAAMQKQLDEQAKLIAELQYGENPSVPSTGISPEAESALRDASATLQAKMDVAVNKLQGAAKTLQEKGSKLAPQDPDFGINPPSQGVPTHELGSIGEGQAVAYVQNGLEELYNTGNEQAQQYADKALSDAKSYTDTQIAGINSRIDGIEEDLETVMATSQAVTAARPYLSSNQTNAIGVGLGNSGSQNAIAVGYAHRINENWTANANLSGTSGNEVDYSVGAGLSYAW